MGIHGVFCFNKRCLWFYGMRFFEFDKVQFNEVEKIREDIYPQSAFYNAFFNSICVLYGNQLKLYTADDGRLSVLHKNLFKDKNERPLAIDLDKRHRKIYLASTSGQIQVMNVQSGVVLKLVHEKKISLQTADDYDNPKNLKKYYDSDTEDEVLKKATRVKLPAALRDSKKQTNKKQEKHMHGKAVKAKVEKEKEDEKAEEED